MTDSPAEAKVYLERYAAMFAAGREGRMLIDQPDGTLSDWSLVIQRIERRLEAGDCRPEDLGILRHVAAEFRAAKEAKARETK